MAIALFNPIDRRTWTNDSVRMNGLHGSETRSKAFFKQFWAWNEKELAKATEKVEALLTASTYNGSNKRFPISGAAAQPRMDIEKRILEESRILFRGRPSFKEEWFSHDLLTSESWSYKLSVTQRFITYIYGRMKHHRKRATKSIDPLPQSEPPSAKLEKVVPAGQLLKSAETSKAVVPQKVSSAHSSSSRSRLMPLAQPKQLTKKITTSNSARSTHSQAASTATTVVETGDLLLTGVSAKKTNTPHTSTGAARVAGKSADRTQEAPIVGGCAATDRKSTVPSKNSVSKFDDLLLFLVVVEIKRGQNDEIHLDRARVAPLTHFKSSDGPANNVKKLWSMMHGVPIDHELFYFMPRTGIPFQIHSDRPDTFKSAIDVLTNELPKREKPAGIQIFVVDKRHLEGIPAIEKAEVSRLREHCVYTFDEATEQFIDVTPIQKTKLKDIFGRKDK